MKRYHFVLSLVLCLVTLGIIYSAAAADLTARAAWLSNTEPVVAKIADLPENQEPVSMGVDCTPTNLPNGASTIDTCAYETPLGTMANNALLNGSKGTYSYDPSNGGFILPSVPNRPSMLITKVAPRSWFVGWALRVGTYDPTALRYAEYYGLPTKKVYEYNGPVGATLKDAAGNPTVFGIGEVGYSPNGKWLVAQTYPGGIVYYDLDTLKGKVIAWDASTYASSLAGYTKTNNMAISDDGRYIAVTLSTPVSTGGTRPALRVYDTASCRDQYANKSTATTSNTCEYKDLWTGEYRTGNTRGIRDVLSAAEYPRRVRFTSNSTLTFDTVYDRTSTTAFKVARYSVTMPQTTTREYVGVLGMGDSYISGEGAYSYRAGTDTKNNKCHTSWRSYPYLAGKQEFTLEMTKSVACSGAKMLDIAVEAGDPAGEVKDEDSYKGQVKNKQQWAQRNQISVIESSSPGYANQTIFAREYKPRATLLSIGGNDINFAGIIKSCIDAGEIPDTCYRYYEDRVKIMEQILGQYDRLVKTYKKVLADSGGRLYVSGYPQIAKTGGACGINVRLTADEIKFSSLLITYLNTVIKRAVAEAGASYIDVENALNGYRLCEAPKNASGVNGLTAGDDKQLTAVVYIFGMYIPVSAGVGNESYHPTQLGHKLLNQAVLSKTSNLTAVMPKPVANNKPTLDYSNALLQNVPHAPEQQRHTEAIKWVNDSDVPPMLLGGNTYTSNISGGALKPGTNMQIVLHSDPVTLYEGKYDPNNPGIFSIPSGTAPGFHTLDVYGTDAAGQPVDLRQAVYVAKSAEDYDSDGFVNTADPCPISQQSNLDEDSDGVDDACDGEVLPASLIEPDEAPGYPALPLDIDSDGASADIYASSLLAPYVPPKADEPAAKEEDVNTPEERATTAASSITVSTAQSVAKKALPLNFGFALSPDSIEPVQTADTAGSATVLGSATKLVKNNPQAPEKGEQRSFSWLLLLGVLTASILAVKFFRRRYN